MTYFAIIDNIGNLLFAGSQAECDEEITFFMGELKIVEFDVESFATVAA